MLSRLWLRAKGWAALVGAVVFAIGVAFLRGRSEGKQVIEAEQQRARDRLQEKYDEVDNRPRDPSRSYDKLRGMSDDKSGR